MTKTNIFHLSRHIYSISFEKQLKTVLIVIFDNHFYKCTLDSVAALVLA